MTKCAKSSALVCPLPYSACWEDALHVHNVAAAAPTITRRHDCIQCLIVCLYFREEFLPIPKPLGKGNRDSSIFICYSDRQILPVGRKVGVRVEEKWLVNTQKIVSTNGSWCSCSFTFSVLTLSCHWTDLVKVSAASNQLNAMAIYLLSYLASWLHSS